MTSAAKVAAILKKLGDAHYQAADELLAIAGDSIDSPELAPGETAGSLPPAPPSGSKVFYNGPSPDEEPAEQGSLAMCPKHRKPYTPSKFAGAPAYCTSTTDDEAWGKSRDGKLWCTINAKNAAEWLRLAAA